MIEDLQRRSLSERTQEMSVRAVRPLADPCHTSPDRITEEALRASFLSLKHVTHSSRAASPVARCGITFFSEQTRKRAWTTLPLVRAPREPKLPVVLSLEGGAYHTGTRAAPALSGLPDYPLLVRAPPPGRHPLSGARD